MGKNLCLYRETSGNKETGRRPIFYTLRGEYDDYIDEDKPFKDLKVVVKSLSSLLEDTEEDSIDYI